MSDAVLTALIGGLVSTVATLAGVVIVWLNLRAKQQELKLATEKLNEKQDEMKKDIDGRMTQLLAATGAASKAEGKVEERGEQAAKAVAVMEVQKHVANGGQPKGPDKATLVEVVNVDKRPVPVDVIEKEKK